MDKKCDKYDALFTFATEEVFQKHLAECEDCRREHERMQRVSELISEVKPQFSQRKDKYRYLKVACVLFMVMLGGASFEAFDSQFGIVETVIYGEQLTAEDLGFPTDSYGLIMVDE